MTAQWDNARDQMQHLVDYLDDVTATLEALSHGYDQMTNDRTNNVMRILTAMSSIMLPLSVISGIYGMNIQGLPMANDEWAFEITLGLMLVVALSLIAFFRYRRWI